MLNSNRELIEIMKNCAIIIVFAFQCRASAARTVHHSAVPSVHDAMKQKIQENIDLKNDRYNGMKLAEGNQSITDNNEDSTESMKMDYSEVDARYNNVNYGITFI
jgi:hypothetical protein